MDLVEHFRLIWRKRWLVVLVSIVIAAGVYAWARTQPKVYEATATIDVIPATTSTDEPITEEQVGLITDRFAAFAGATTVLEDAIERSGLDIGVSTARGRASAAASADPGFVSVRVVGPSP